MAGGCDWLGAAVKAQATGIEGEDRLRRRQARGNRLIGRRTDGRAGPETTGRCRRKLPGASRPRSETQKMLLSSACIVAHQKTSMRIFLRRRASKGCFQHRFRSLPSDYTALTDYAAIDQRVAGWPVWLASRCGWLGSGRGKQLVAHEKMISGQRQSPRRPNVRYPAAEGKTTPES